MYPAEYNVFANGRNPVMTYKYDPLAAGWRKYFNIYDELGSVALVINDSGRVVESNQYKAFVSYHYDSDLGRFLCPDAMWEK